MKKLFLAFAFLSTAFLSAQVTIQDDAKVGVLVTGTGNTINTTQIFGKSPEYAELKKRLDGLQAAITKKADKCDKYTDPVAKEDCRAELIALNAERDSVQKIEARFREDVIRLAETFANIPLNSERLRLAKQLFEEGKIREADNMLKIKEMQQEGEALLARKGRLDTLLRVKADEFALKARLKATDYADSLRYDSAQIYFRQSQRYAETVENLWGFADLLGQHYQDSLAIKYYERALDLARSKKEEAALCMNLGLSYFMIQRPLKAEEMYRRSLEIEEDLVEINPAQFESHLAKTTMNLGLFYQAIQDMAKAESMYLRSLGLYEHLSGINPAQFEAGLALTEMNLGLFYYTTRKMLESEKMYLRSLDIYERLVNTNPKQFEPGLALTTMNLGLFYYEIHNMQESKKMYLRSLDIYQRFVKYNPAEFEPGLALTTMNLGLYYYANQNLPESKNMYLRSLGIYKLLVKRNPKEFEPGLALTLMNLGLFYCTDHNMLESEKMYLLSLEIYERLTRNSPKQSMHGLSLTLSHFGYFRQINGQFKEAKNMYSRGLTLYQRAISSGQIYFWENLMQIYNDMADLCDSFQLQGDWNSVMGIQRERAACMDSLANIIQAAAENAPRDYGRLSWYCLFARRYSEAQTTAEKALVLDPAQNWVRIDLGHSWLLRGEWDKAKAAYEQYIVREKDPVESKKILEKDWCILEAAGVMHKDIAKARAWAKE